ncbi:unnamed protein product [Parnassius mnemosyne]|uniref:Uncharacterized protein n=1 Tax=Parnassius mnemosyne TaxID=213953 RepID=A0AAV1KGU4_9NEOP
MGEHETTSKAMVIMELQSRVDSNFRIKVEAFVLKTITAPLPTCKIDPSSWIELEGLVLADPEYHTPSHIDMLLGVGIYNQILLEGIKRSPEGELLAQATSLGWILSGQITMTAQSAHKIKVLHCCSNDNDLLKRFWELEAEPEIKKEKMFTDEEKRCEEIFNKTTTRDDEGRYIVRLPLKNDPPQVDGSKEISERRFYTLENKFNKNKNLKDKYTEVMKEYIDLNHMELVQKEHLDNPLAIYLPHHAVIREDKDTTKVRVVYDASCKGKNNMSLNDNLLIGPTLQPELRHLVMRWRIPPICLTADIGKMYRQVKISDLDVDFQRIIWRDNVETEMKHYRMLRVTFGTASAPYLAVKALQQLALDEGDSYPMAAKRVLTDYYMDDLLTGCQTKEEGLRIFHEMNELLSKGGFELMKWTSNCEELVESMKGEKGKGDVQEGLKIKSDETLKIVGLTWDRSEDSFRYAVNLPKLEQPVTKRKIISDISRFYDPLGWVGPSIIKSKVIIQRLWLAGIEWDEAVPKSILDEWLAYREELKLLETINIPRWVHTNADDSVELHGFCDASNSAYAAVIYIRVIDSSGAINVSLLTAKTKVAPVKQVSIPRLELCGAVLLSRLILETARVLGIEKRNIRAWTDSTVVLAWINNHPSRWKVFVANRVSEIQSNLDSHNWSHISSKENAADAASRGLSPQELVKNSIWFNGPDFLRNSTINYEKPKEVTTNLEKVKSHCAVVGDGIWERFSSLTRMKRVIAYCKRFINNLSSEPNKRKRGYLTTQELTEAQNVCIKQYQAIHFKEEILLVKQKSNLPKGSKLRSLNPVMDADEILRVGGRLELSGLSRNQKHPILIPKKCHLTNLIIADAHKNTLHGGPQLMICYIQVKYWILGAKQSVRSYFRKCLTCAKNSPNTQTQLMGQLPAARVTPIRPFKCSGVDYAGPIQIRTAKGRGHKSHKGYICLFVCMATKAIHLEVVTDLSSQGFLQAFKRFVSRRGHCSDLWSDNATNFTGAANELKRLFLTENGSMLQEVAESVANNDCNWHFIPARSPNFGGLWEAGVKSVKYHLKRVIGQSTLTFEEMSTVLAQVEACLNSRPLSVIRGDSDDIMVLTPGHFLVGEPIVTPPDQNYESHTVSSLRRWQFTQRMLQDFWKKWSQEYLTKFLHRYKWSSVQPQPKVGDVVLVKEDGLPPCRWLYGRVIETHPGKDNLVRVITLKTKNGTFKRPISKVCLLPIATE